MSQLSLRKGFAFAAALLLVGAAIAVAVVTHGSGSSNARTELTHIAKKGDPDLGNAKATPGEGSPGAVRAAEEDYAHRAFPADEIPFQAQVNARKAFAAINARFQASLTADKIFSQLNRGGASVGKFTPGSWSAIGSFSADYPGVLTFFGADYTTSGRTTAMAISPSCTDLKCQLWIGAAGGGVWRTYNALSDPPGQSWQFVSGSFGSNAIGYLTYSNGVLYAGTGETHASGDSEAGMGIWKSTDAGATWMKLPSTVTNLTTPGNGTYTGDAFAGRAISSIVVDPLNPKSIWVGSGRAVRGVTSVTGNAVSNPPLPRPPFGLFHSNDGGQTFDFVWNGAGTIRGVTRVALDPSSSQVIYASAYQTGLYRSMNGGTSFTQILPSIDPGLNASRIEFAVTKLSGGNTRIYVGNGASGATPAARFQRTDDAKVAVPVFVDLTTSQNQGYCTAQCWYDQFVYTPAGYPDTVYLGGSFDYSTYGGSTNGRGVLLSQNAGVNWTDQTADATTGPTPPGNCCNPNAIAPHSLHPDQQVFVTNPNNPLQWFEGSDGGIVRSSGQLADISSQCASRGLGPTSLARCQALLSAVPTVLTSLNKGLNTLQFQSLSVASDDVSHVQGGTQDNGTFENYGANYLQQPQTWPQIIYGDGGLSGFQTGNSNIRFNSFYGQFHDANVDNGAPTEWYIISGPIAASPEGSNFYAPILADPHPLRAGTIFEGSQSVWRTQDWGGDSTVLKATCPEFFTSGSDPSCGDFEPIGGAPSSDLTSAAWGTRAGFFDAYLARTPSDTGTLWAATNGGRVFISKNADATPANTVVWTRLDTLAANDPQRSITAISVDPNNPNHAFISYTGYNFNTPSQPGHVFSVTYDPSGASATWTSLDGSTLADLPVTSVAYDNVKDDLYASTDFGVLRLPHATTAWTMAGSGLPVVEVAGLTIVPGARKLYAATHGMGAWQMNLPGN